MLGLEDERTVFARYQAIRRAERDYLPDAPDGVAAGPHHRAGMEAGDPAVHA